jgi:nucleotide-binding universal stress UspA family protein
VTEIEQALVTESEAYLQEIVRRIPTQRVPIHTAVSVGKPADTIIEHACQCGNAMVVMATHGHRRIEQWPLGSIAEKVLRSLRVPLFLVRAPQPEPTT